MQHARQGVARLISGGVGDVFQRAARSDLILELVDAVLVTDPTLGGTSNPGRVKVDTSAASNPEYRAVAGSEVRLYPVTITGFQQRTVA